MRLTPIPRSKLLFSAPRTKEKHRKSICSQFCRNQPISGIKTASRFAIVISFPLFLFSPIFQGTPTSFFLRKKNPRPPPSAFLVTPENSSESSDKKQLPQRVVGNFVPIPIPKMFLLKLFVQNSSS